MRWVSSDSDFACSVDSGVVGVWAENHGSEVRHFLFLRRPRQEAHTDQRPTLQLPLAYVVLKDPSTASPAKGKEIQAWVKERIANHKQLRGGVRFVDAIPKSPSGKILRRILRDQAKKEGPVVDGREFKL